MEDGRLVTPGLLPVVVPFTPRAQIALEGVGERGECRRDGVHGCPYLFAPITRIRIPFPLGGPEVNTVTGAPDNGGEGQLYPVPPPIVGVGGREKH